jgi:site-specific recombinase XerD
MIKLEVAHNDFVKNLEADGKSKSTIIAYSKDIEQLTDFLSQEGIVLVSEIELSRLEKFMKKLANENYTPKSISRKTNAIRTFFKFLHNLGYVKDNVAAYLKHPKVDIKAPRILTKVEYRALRDAAKEDFRTYAMIEVLLQTGLTISELAEMELGYLDIKGETGTLFVPKRNNKEARNIPLNKAVIEALRKYLENERPMKEGTKNVFITKTGNPLLIRNIRSTLDRYFKLAGVENAKVNDLRHTFVAHHLAAGVNLLHLSRIAGHKRISTTERYLQYIEKVEVTEKTELGVL